MGRAPAPSAFRAFFLIGLVLSGPHAALATQVRVGVHDHARQVPPPAGAVDLVGPPPAGGGADSPNDDLVGPPPAGAPPPGAPGSPEADAARYQAGLHDAGMSNVSTSRIDSVITTMRDILTSVEDAEKTDAGNYKCFMEWCDSEILTFNNSLTRSSDSLNTHTLATDENNAAIATLGHEIGEAKDEIAEVKDMLEQATNIRNEEVDQYTEDSTVNQQSRTQIDRAVATLGVVHNQGGFLQNGVLKRLQINEPGESNYVLGVMKGLKQRLEKSKTDMDAAETTKVGQYDELQTTKNAQLTSLEGDVSEKNTLLSEKRISLVEAENDGGDASRDVETLKQYLFDVQERCNKKSRDWQVRGDDRQVEKAALKEAISFLEQTAQEEIAEANAAVAAAAPEAAPVGLVAVKSASKTASKMVQADAVDDTDADADDDDDDDSDDAAPAFLQVQQLQHHRAALSFLQSSTVSQSGVASLVASANAQFAALIAGVDTRTKREGFDGAITIVKDLAKVLKEQQAEEDRKRTYCQSEIATKDTEKVTTSDKIDAMNATIMRKTTQIQSYTDEIDAINRTVNQAALNDQEAKTLRDGEKVAYEAGTRDRELAVKVIRQAKQVLKEFYETSEPTSLMQKSHKKQDPAQPGLPERTDAPETWSSTQSQRAPGGDQMALMMEKIAEDIEKEQRDALIDEKDSETQYEKYVQESREAFDKRMDDMTKRVTRKAKALVQVNNHNEEMSSLSEDLTSIETQLTSLHGECDALLQNHAQRRDERAFELRQLRDVVDILSGASIAARTGLVQKNQQASAQPPPAPVQSVQPVQQQRQPGATNDQEVAALQDLSSSINGLEGMARSLAR